MQPYSEGSLVSHCQLVLPMFASRPHSSVSDSDLHGIRGESLLDMSPDRRHGTAECETYRHPVPTRLCKPPPGTVKQGIRYSIKPQTCRSTYRHERMSCNEGPLDISEEVWVHGTRWELLVRGL